jgi:hypothetical protein
VQAGRRRCHGPRYPSEDGLIALQVFGQWLSATDVGGEGSLAERQGLAARREGQIHLAIVPNRHDRGLERCVPAAEAHAQAWTQPPAHPEKRTVALSAGLGRPQEQGLGDASGGLAAAQASREHPGLVHDQEVPFA